MFEQKRLSIAVVDDHRMVRMGFAHEINSFHGFAVTHEAANGEEYLQISANSPIDIAIIDLRMPRMDGWATIAYIKAHQKHTRTLALTFDPHGLAVQRAFRVGACGVIDKGISGEDLHKALRDVHLSGFHHNAISAEHLLQVYKPPQRRRRGAVLDVNLTMRELDLLLFICRQGALPYQQFANEHGISLDTVHTHRKHLMAKINCTSREDVILWAVKNRVIAVDGADQAI